MDKATGEWQWPFAQANLGVEGPIAQALLAELGSLDTELAAATGERPALAAYLTDQQKDLAAIGDQIRGKEVELSSAIAASEMATQAMAKRISISFQIATWTVVFMA
ncbi:hypothetical protein [Mesorhizobium sp.]|uniref:hypothetical protein n=1 Tax=Mesorhizobium sp. TaxID=1871066 RepID=UPI0012134C58|nr:hypothetical protein [Mesorhizobium sp.]TIP09169.1 MAG: hypothetical protein E5X73_28040 [Mesorhizobium sp.]